MPLSQFQYSPLESPNHIRLIYLFSGNAGESLRCEIRYASLDNLLPYEASSYVWGDPQMPERLMIGNDHYLNITLSLFHALRDMRAPRV
jgi:hypothetical protein